MYHNKHNPLVKSKSTLFSSSPRPGPRWRLNRARVHASLAVKSFAAILVETSNKTYRYDYTYTNGRRAGSVFTSVFYALHQDQKSPAHRSRSIRWCCVCTILWVCAIEIMPWSYLLRVIKRRVSRLGLMFWIFPAQARRTTDPFSIQFQFDAVDIDPFVSIKSIFSAGMG